MTSKYSQHGWIRIYEQAARLDRFGTGLMRAALVLVLFWIGGIKFADYEAESIVPFVANSPLMNFFYARAAPEYQHYMHREGELVPAHHHWHETNKTYVFARGLGTVIIAIGLLIALHPLFPQAGMIGSFLLVGMSCTTLSFLITTPEVWVPAPGGAGFPFLSGAGRLVVKDAIMLGAAVVTMADSAASFLRKATAG